MGKPTGDTLPVFSAYSFASILNQREREIIFPRKNVPDARIDRGTTASSGEADTLLTELLVSGPG